MSDLTLLFIPLTLFDTALCAMYNLHHEQYIHKIISFHNWMLCCIDILTIKRLYCGQSISMNFFLFWIVIITDSPSIKHVKGLLALYVTLWVSKLFENVPCFFVISTFSFLSSSASSAECHIRWNIISIISIIIISIICWLSRQLEQEWIISAGS